MTVKIEMNPRIINENCSVYLRDIFTYSANKRIPLEDFQRIAYRRGIYYLLDHTYDRGKKIAVQRLLERLGIVIDCWRRSWKYDRKS